MLRTLAHYWRINVAVVLGAAVATAVLAGAILVGDSVRGSLRDLTLDRLGDIDLAVVAAGFFREGLVDDIEEHPLLAEVLSKVAPAVVLQGSATHRESGSRASGVGIYGVDERFASLFGAEAALDFGRAEGQILPSVVINESLSGELGVAAGDSILLSFGRWSAVPRETLLGDTDPEDVLGAIRLAVRRVIPDRGAGRFGMTARQQRPLNAFVSMRQLQRPLDLRGHINGIFAASSGHETGDVDELLREVLTLEDLGLKIVRADDHLRVESREIVLRPEVEEVVEEVAREVGAPLMSTQAYLANATRLGGLVMPYSMVVALDPRPELSWGTLWLADGSPARSLGADGILLNTWAAEDLGATVGDTVEMTYYVVGPREEMLEDRTSFRVEGVVAMRDLGADSSLAPDFPGMHDADDIAAWDPPFPVDLALIRDKDEAYWDDHGATPKAFVSESAGRRLWNTRFGSTTAARIGASAEADLDGVASALHESLMQRLEPESFGLTFHAVKQQGLAAAAGATDFSGLFIGFSLFLIVSAALLVGLLFRLGVEQRAGEIGLLLAVGHSVVRVRRRLVAEGGLLAALGALIGLAGGVGYAGLMMLGLRTLWKPAVGSSELFLHVPAKSLALGWAISVVVVLASILLAVRKLVRVPPSRLLSGSFREAGKLRSGLPARILAFGGLLGALAMMAFALITGALASPGLAFGTALLLLVSGLAFFSLWCRSSSRRGLALGTAAVVGMAARNSAWSPGRSILSVALVASACFMIVAIGANREEPGHGLEARDSGSGGFSLIAEADTALHDDINDPEGRFDLGFSTTDAAALGDATVYPMRLLPGDDASCLNLYKPEKPRVIGVGDDFIRRGGFPFQQSLDLPEGAESPWVLLHQPLDDDAIPAVADFNSARWILKVGLGDELTVENERGEDVRLRLVGLLGSSIFQSEVLVSEENFLRHFPDRMGHAYFLVDAPAEQTDRVASVLEGKLDAYGFDVTSTREKLAGFKSVENTYLATFQTLGALGLLLGTVGLGVVLVRNVLERRGELATLRAFGFRRSRLAWMVLAENAFLLVIGMGIGTLAALAAIAPRLAVLHVPWSSLAVTLVVILAVGMLSSVAAVLGTLRVPLLPALKAER